LQKTKALAEAAANPAPHTLELDRVFKHSLGVPSANKPDTAKSAANPADQTALPGAGAGDKRRRGHVFTVPSKAKSIASRETLKSALSAAQARGLCSS
jgi:hypothetical protein